VAQIASISILRYNDHFAKLCSAHQNLSWRRKKKEKNSRRRRMRTAARRDAPMHSLLYVLRAKKAREDSGKKKGGGGEEGRREAWPRGFSAFEVVGFFSKLCREQGGRKKKKGRSGKGERGKERDGEETLKPRLVHLSLDRFPATTAAVMVLVGKIGEGRGE